MCSNECYATMGMWAQFVLTLILGLALLTWGRIKR